MEMSVVAINTLPFFCPYDGLQKVCDCLPCKLLTIQVFFQELITFTELKPETFSLLTWKEKEGTN